jgi:enoyl-CoA hydratase
MATVSISHIRVDRHTQYLRLCFNRPDRYHAIDSATLRSLSHLLQPARHMAMPLVLSGDADLFSVGADIAELASLTDVQAAMYSRLGHHVLEALESWPGVTIAHMSGYALGAGLELALGCDLIVSSPDVRIGLPGLAWALVPCMGGLRRMACRSNERFSSELFLHGAVLSADQARKEHLLDRVLVDDAELTALIGEMADYSTSAVRVIRAVRLERQGRIDAATGARMFSLPFASGECQRRLKSLLTS